MSRKRRGRGEGSVFQRRDGLWAATLSVGYNETGRRRRKTVYGSTKQTVLDKLAAIQGQRAAGGLADAEKISTADYLRGWLDTTAASRVRSSTLSRYRQLCRIHIIPQVGGVPLASLEPRHVIATIDVMERAGLSSRTRQFVHAVLRKALADAVVRGLIVRNVANAVPAPKVERKEHKTLTAEQAAAFVDAASTDRLSALFVLALMTGARQGELFGLQPDDIDFENSTLTIRRTLVEVGNEFLVNPPKTSSSRRLVHLPPAAVEAIHGHLKQRMADGHAGSRWLFCDSRGGPLRRGNLSRKYKRLLKEAGLPPFRFHDLRHTAATLLFGSGVDVKTVADLLGHSKPSTTLDTYAASIPSLSERATATMGRLLSSSVG